MHKTTSSAENQYANSTVIHLIEYNPGQLAPRSNRPIRHSISKREAISPKWCVCVCVGGGGGGVRGTSNMPISTVLTTCPLFGRNSCFKSNLLLRVNAGFNWFCNKSPGLVLIAVSVVCAKPLASCRCGWVAV